MYILNNNIKYTTYKKGRYFTVSLSSTITATHILIRKYTITHVRLKKNKSYVSKLPRAFVFRCAFDSAKFKVWIFFCLLTCLSKYTRKDMTDTMKHFEQQTSSTLCSVLYLVHPKSSSIFQSCEQLKSDTSAAQKKKKKKNQLKNRI